MKFLVMKGIITEIFEMTPRKWRVHPLILVSWTKPKLLKISDRYWYRRIPWEYEYAVSFKRPCRLQAVLDFRFMNSTKKAERIELIFGIKATFGHEYIMYIHYIWRRSSSCWKSQYWLSFWEFCRFGSFWPHLVLSIRRSLNVDDGGCQM